jgi:hypothetical protein
MSSDCCHPTYTFEAGAYNATQVRLYGIPGGDLETALALFDLQPRGSEEMKTAGVELGALLIKVKNGRAVMLTLSAPGEAMSAGVIFGYAYEGNCYDLPKPKVMLLPTNDGPIPPDDCGFDKKASADYRLWIVDKLDECIEIEISAGFIEQLVLEANMPGKRSPSTYRATMALAHRSGRLTD